MWGDGPGGKTDSKFGIKKTVRSPKTIILGDNKITVHFSPTSPTLPWSQSSNGLIEQTLNSAKKSIDMALFVFSEQRLANTLEQLHQQDVSIRALIDKQFIYRYYSEGLDMMGVALSNKCQYEINNKPWSNPVTTVGVPNLPKGDVLHHKFALVDKQAVITGSHNWSDAANYGNDETLIVINNPITSAHYEREFTRLYSKAQVGVPEKVQAKIKQEQKQCNQIKSPTSTELTTAKVVNINTASSTELETLPGVGKN
jgi:phosphatidylserine/phosphatidylglycerophosphate/cardiolipin synthase-like enzyme